MSAPNSLQFNHLIGGAISPSVLAAQSVQQQVQQQQQQQLQFGQVFAAQQQQQQAQPAHAHIQQLTHQQGTILGANQQVNQSLMIGDYVQGNLSSVLGNSAYRQ